MALHLAKPKGTHGSSRSTSQTLKSARLTDTVSEHFPNLPFSKFLRSSFNFGANKFPNPCQLSAIRNRVQDLILDTQSDQPHMKKLAIISSYNEKCGNASYTHALKLEFSKFVDVTVLPLDLFLLQSPYKSLKNAADRHIKRICETISTFDYVNIQFEAGLYGSRTPDILRRIKWLIDAAPNLILTMHRVDTGEISFFEALRATLKARSFSAFRKVKGQSHFAKLTGDIIRHCKAAGKSKNLWIKVHTRKDTRAINELFSFANVFDFPLTFMGKNELLPRAPISNREAFLSRYGFSPSDKVVGLFGYLSEYKGIETAIDSLSRLPLEYKLGLFGSQHPQTIKRNEAVSPYIEKLINQMDDIDEEMQDKAEKSALVHYLANQPAADLCAESGNSIAERIHFIGSLNDEDFVEALRLCDVVVLPYLEVGQSMSGVVVLGLEAGARLICANNHSFSEVKRYYTETFVSFDVGNAHELARKIALVSSDPERFNFRENRTKAFERFNRERSIQLQLEKFGCSTAAFGVTSRKEV